MRIKTKYTYEASSGNTVTTVLVKDSDYMQLISKENRMKYIQDLAHIIGAIEPHQTLTTMEPASSEEAQFWEECDVEMD